jgi:hypothetical protein
MFVLLLAFYLENDLAYILTAFSVVTLSCYLTRNNLYITYSIVYYATMETFLFSLTLFENNIDNMWP